MDEGRKRVLAIVAGMIVSRHLDTADDLFGGPQGSPRTDKMVAAAVQWADRILKKIDNVDRIGPSGGVQGALVVARELTVHVRQRTQPQVGVIPGSRPHFY